MQHLVNRQVSFIFRNDALGTFDFRGDVTQAKYGTQNTPKLINHKIPEILTSKARFDSFAKHYCLYIFVYAENEVCASDDKAS